MAQALKVRLETKTVRHTDASVSCQKKYSLALFVGSKLLINKSEKKNLQKAKQTNKQTHPTPQKDGLKTVDAGLLEL